MIKIKIWADTHSTGLFKEIGEQVTLNETSISQGTWQELQNWVLEYDYIIPMIDYERNKVIKEIKALDKKGLIIKEKLETEWKIDELSGQNIEFQYFSEGLQKFIELK